MPKYVHVAVHLTRGELEQQYRKADDPVERSHFQVIWLLAQGKRVREVAEVTGYCANWSEDSGAALQSRRTISPCRSASAQRWCFSTSLWSTPAVVTAGACSSTC